LRVRLRRVEGQGQTTRRNGSDPGLLVWWGRWEGKERPRKGKKAPRIGVSLRQTGLDSGGKNFGEGVPENQKTGGVGSKKKTSTELEKKKEEARQSKRGIENENRDSLICGVWALPWGGKEAIQNVGGSPCGEKNRRKSRTKREKKKQGAGKQLGERRKRLKDCGVGGKKPTPENRNKVQGEKRASKKHQQERREQAKQYEGRLHEGGTPTSRWGQTKCNPKVPDL